MNRPRQYRWLRIAVSAVCLMMFCLLLALWVRSYWWMDTLDGPWFNTGIRRVQSKQGQLVFVTNIPRPILSNWHHTTDKILEGSVPISWHRKWRWDSSALGIGVSFPHGLLILLSAIVVAVPWLPWNRIRWRFSLRTMLIVTAVVAAILGLGVSMVRG